MDLTTVVLIPLADAFMQVGVFVAVLIAAFGWLRWRHGDRLISTLEKHRRWAPVLGAVLGVSPGCAGAILVMPLYARGTVSFGSAVAALVATMGDSSWVLMAADPGMAAKVHLVLFVAGLATGYVVDALGISPRTTHRTDIQQAEPPSPPRAGAGVTITTVGVAARVVVSPKSYRGTTGAVAAALAVPLETVPVLFWFLVGTSFILAAPARRSMPWTPWHLPTPSAGWTHTSPSESPGRC